MTQLVRGTGTCSSVRRHVPELALEWILDTPERRWHVLDGTLCFADISGFTALAERLAQRGRIGGEELISRLGGVFTAMLDLARERGGSLVKFGGDALLLFFEGPDHALQAASASVAMRQVLREAAASPSSIGPLRLSMSVGLHSGSAHFFLVGSNHRELVLAGPAANAVLQAEKLANAGEILLSGTTAALLPKEAFRARPDGLPLLRWRKPPLRPCGPRPSRSVPEGRLQALLPKVLHDLLAPGAPEPEHRVACIAFVRFTGLDHLLECGGPDAAARALDDTLGSVQACLEKEAVTLLACDVDRDGGKLFLGSGVPYAHADDEGNMLRALRGITELHLPLGVQLGVNRGHVFVAEVGSPSRAAYSAMGDTTNVAARIAARAPAGVIYAHPSVLDESLAVFQVAPATPLALKGKKAPLAVYEVGPQTGTRRREGLAVAEFLGRTAELNAVLAAIAAIERGCGSVLCVTGESGIGKSKLVGEAVARARRNPLLALRGEPNADSSAYALIREPLRRLLDLERLAPERRGAALIAKLESAASELVPFAALVGELMGIDLPPSPETAAIDPRFRVERASAALFRLLAGEHPGPQIWMVDDAQWCDESSSHVLGQLARECGVRPWLLLVARRPGTGGFQPDQSCPGAAHLSTLALGGLPHEQLVELIQLASEAAPLRPHELNAIVSRAGGNPFFALEMLRAAREIGSFDAVPESLEAAIAVQVDALDPPARRLLRYASVLGRSFSLELLTRALRGDGEEVEQATLDRLNEFLEREGSDRLRFRSDVISDTTYQGLSYRLRRQLHQRVGETIEAMLPDPTDDADTLAMHFSRSEDHARALRYARTAAERARERYANAEAARFYGLALEAARHEPAVAPATRIELLTRLGEVRERAGLLEDSLDAYAEALRLADADPLERAGLLYSRAAAKERTRSFKGALHDLRAGLRLLEGNPSRQASALRARLHTTIAWVLFGQDRPARALTQARLAAREAREVDEQSSLGAALMIMDLAGLMVEGPGPGDYLKEALAIFERLGDLRMQASVEANLGFLCAVAGRWQEAVRWFEAARERFTRVGDIVRSADPALNLGEMLVKQRRYQEAEPILREAIRVLRATRFSEGVNRGEIQLARILIERSELAEAESILARVQESFTGAGQHLAALEAATTRALGRLRGGAVEAALELLDIARRTAGVDAGVLLPTVACERARILATLGDLPGALDELRAGLEAARAHQLPYEEALLLQLKASVVKRSGTPMDAAEEEAAQRILSGLGVRLETA